MTTISHPDYQPGRGERSADRGISLHNEAADAIQVWAWIYNNREQGLDPYHDLNRLALAELTSAGDLRSELVTLAIADAEAAPLQPEIPVGGWDDASKARLDAARFARYNAAAKIRDCKQQAAPAIGLPIEQEDTCRHGVAFADTCTACDAES